MDLNPSPSVLNSYVKHSELVPNFSVTYQIPEENYRMVVTIYIWWIQYYLGPVEILHWSEVRTLPLLHLMTSDSSNNKKDDSSYCRSHAGVFTLSDQISNWAEVFDQSHVIGGEDSHGWSYWLLRSCNHHSGRALSMREVRKCDACDESSGISTRSHF